MAIDNVLTDLAEPHFSEMEVVPVSLSPLREQRSRVPKMIQRGTQPQTKKDERNEVMVGAWIQDHDESLQKAMPKALTSVTDIGSHLMQASLPPRKGGQCSCVVGNPVQYGVPA